MVSEKGKQEREFTYSLRLFQLAGGEKGEGRVDGLGSYSLRER